MLTFYFLVKTLGHGDPNEFRKRFMSPSLAEQPMKSTEIWQETASISM